MSSDGVEMILDKYVVMTIFTNVALTLFCELKIMVFNINTTQ